MNSSKHFEQVWEEAERLSSQISFNLEKNIEELKNNLTLLKNNSDISKNKDIFGNVLFLLCHLSLNLDINSYTALLKIIQDRKSALLDEGD